MRQLAIFLVLFALAVSLLVLGETVGPHALVYASVLTFGLLAIWVLLRGTSNVIDFGTVMLIGKRRKDG